LNGGFFAIAGTITKLSLKIGGWLLKNTVGRFFGALGNLLKSAGTTILGMGKQKPPVAPARPGGGVPITTSGGVQLPKNVKAPSGPLNFLRGKGGIFNALFGAFEFGIRKQGGQSNLQAGAGAASSVAGSIAGAKAGAVIGAFGGPLAWATVPLGTLIGGGIGWTLGGKLSDTATGVGNDKPAVTPQTPVVPKNKTPNAPAVNEQPFNQTMGDLTSQANKIDWTKPAQFGEFSITPDQGTQAQVSSQSTQANIKTPAQTSKIATLPLNVGPAPEPTPNVVYKRIGSPAQQQSGAAPTGGSVNEVPAISASNPDNFYVLYSQVNYNVVT
jgi:hypothetical protein